MVIPELEEFYWGNKTFTKKEVMSIIWDVFEYYDIYNNDKYKINFEMWLNRRWLNWNGWDNEELEWQFDEEEREWFIPND